MRIIEIRYKLNQMRHRQRFEVSPRPGFRRAGIVAHVRDTGVVDGGGGGRR
jgi:hypothetical protein